MQNFIIGFDGLSGVGKTSTAITLCENNNYLYLELDNLCRKIAPIYAKLKEKYSLNYAVEHISNLHFEYDICDNNICFKIIESDSSFVDEKINIRNEIYEMVQIEHIKNKIYDFLKSIIDELKNNHSIILVGKELELIYSKLDYHFLFTSNEEDIIGRIMIKDKIPDKQARYIKNIEESIYSFSQDVIICNTSRLKIEETVNLIQNVLNYRKIKKDKVKVQFLGTQSTGKSTISTYCSRYFNDQYVSERLRDYMEENQLGYFDILSWSPDNWYDLICTQIKNEEDAQKKSIKFTFVDSAAILYAIDFNLFKVPKIKALIDEQLSTADLVFVCDNDIPYIEDGIRPSRLKVVKNQQTIINYLNNLRIPYIVLSGDVEQRLKTVEQIIKN